MIAKQFAISPAAGKRLIAKGIATHPIINEALEKKRTIVIVAGTTNGYVAEEILLRLNDSRPFEKSRFFRGVTLPPSATLSKEGRLPNESEFPGDVVLQNGVWQPGKTIFDVQDQLKKRDVVIKGANAVSLPSYKTAVYIGHPKAGTIGAALPVVVGKRVQLMVPVGLEKRVSDDLDRLVQKINSPDTSGPRMLPLPVSGYTEIQALCQLTGANVNLAAAGGIGGAEGLCWLLVEGHETQIQMAEQLYEQIKYEPNFAF